MVRIGVIGAGGNGSGHARYYHGCERSTVLGVADPDGKRARVLAGEVSAEAVEDFRDLLGRVDAMVISSPNHLHRDHAVACAEAGRHIYCEKPMGIDSGQAAEIAGAVRQAGIRSVVGFSIRFGAVIHTMLRRVRDGRVGEVRSIFARRMGCTDPGRGAGWRADHSLSGGVLFEINVHELDWMMALGGAVEAVYGRKMALRSECERANDHVWCTLSFQGGAVGTLEGSSVAHASAYDRGVLGSDGALVTTDWGRGLAYCEGGKQQGELELGPAFDLRAHFLDCIEEDAAPVADAQWGLKVMEVADAVIESAISGRAVEL